MNLVLCAKCGKRVHSRYAGVKCLTTKFSRTFACMKYEENIGKAVEQDEKLCDEVEQ